MKLVQSLLVTTVALLAASVALLAVGCGGNNNKGVIPVSSLGTPRIEAIVQVPRTNLIHPNNWTDAQLLDPTNQALKADLIVPTVFGFQDMTNFQTGEDYVFQLAAYTANGTRVVLSATFSSSDVNEAYGILADNSGVFLAANTATTSPLTIYASYNGVSYTNLYDIKARQARVIGTVKLQTSNAAVSGAVVQYYDINGNLVGSVTSAADGSFRASVPQSAQTFTVDSHSLTSSLYPVFTFDSATFTAGDADCRAALPLLIVGTQLQDPIFLLPTSQPAPASPPNGCPAGAS